MTKTYTDLQEPINLAINWTGENEELDCNIELIEDNQSFKAYAVSVCHRELLFYTDKASMICYEIIED